MHDMCHHQHFNENISWMQCTMCRSLNQGVEVLRRATNRKVDWDQVKPISRKPIGLQEVNTPYTSLDEAFSTVLNYMSMASRQCKRYYSSCSCSQLNEKDKTHCCRFHKASLSASKHQNPLQRAEDVHVVVEPGMYAITAGSWTNQNKQTHVVHVDRQKTVELDFVI